MAESTACLSLVIKGAARERQRVVPLRGRPGAMLFTFSIAPCAKSSRADS